MSQLLVIESVSIRQDANDDVLLAFDQYARQFTYNNHKADPSNFPKSFPWFKAGYLAGVAAVNNMQQIEK